MTGTRKIAPLQRSTVDKATLPAAPCLTCGSDQPHVFSLHTENAAPGQQWARQWVGLMCQTCNTVSCYNEQVRQVPASVSPSAAHAGPGKAEADRA